jgi:MFS transporter, PAT family, beta-lactamase induction signal transducer AmpG
MLGRLLSTRRATCRGDVVTDKARVTWRDLADARVALMLAFGYSAGLPLLLVFGTLSAWLRESGVAVTTIGLFSWLALAYSFKFLWSPLVDAFDVPVLSRLVGRRRAWMLASQTLVALGLVGVGFSDPGANIAVTAAFTFLVAFGSATQDVVVDGWRIDAAPTSRQGIMAAAYQLGYRLALICAGAGALYLAEFVNWRAAYLSMAALMSVGMVASLLAPVVDRAPGLPDGRTSAPQAFDFSKAIVAPLADLYGRKGAMLIPILALVALYRLPDFVAGVMANPLYIDLGFSKTDIANVSKLYGVWVGMVGAFVGGLLVPKLGLRVTLLIGAMAGAGSNLMFSWLALEGAKLELLILAISIDNFSASFAGTALIAYMSGLTAPGFAATQYALLSSLYALPGKLVGGISGFIVASFGYATFFTLTAAVGIPVVLLCLLVARWSADEDADREEQPSGAAPEAAAARAG